MHKGTGDKTENLISELSARMYGVRALAHPYVRCVPPFVLSLLYIGGVVYFAGLRPDFGVKIHDAAYRIECFLALALFVSSTIASAWVAVPDMRGQRRIAVLPFVFALCLIGFSVRRSMQEGLMLPLPHWDMCFNEGLLMGLVPLALMMMMTMRGATTRPFLSAVLNMFSVTALVYVGLRLTCMMDTVGHSLIYHVFPFVVAGTVLGVFARKLYRW